MICKHDINVFINRQLIYNYPEQLFADKGVMAIEHADFDGIERLALVTGSVSSFASFTWDLIEYNIIQIDLKLVTMFKYSYLGGEIVSTFGKPELVKVGKCDLIEQISIGDETLVKFR